MALDRLSVRILLDEVHCFDEGDGWGSAEPYLWTVFFKIDGATASVTPSLTLSGTATVHTTPGSHGNLPNSDVDEGETVPIPAAIGEWSTVLQAIPVPAFLESLVPDGLPGVAGVVCVLMEEDNVTDAGAEAGHQALNAAVQQALNAIIATRTVSNPSVTDAEIEEFTSGIEGAISGAIQSQQSFFENIWSWLNKDDQIGSKVFLFTHDDLETNGNRPFSHRWRSEGDWELRGRVLVSPVCTIDLTDFFADLFSVELDKDAMREFRAEELPDRANLGEWIQLVERNNAVLGELLVSDERRRGLVIDLTERSRAFLAARDEPVDDELIDATIDVLGGLVEGHGRRARIDVMRLVHVLEELRGHTPNQVIEELSAFRPGRRPLLDRPDAPGEPPAAKRLPTTTRPTLAG